MVKEKRNNEEVNKAPEKLDESSTPSSTPSKKFKIPRLRWIVLGIILIVVAVLVVDYMQVILRPPQLMGQVLDSDGLPVEGATIFTDGKVALSGPEGVFRIQARVSDKLTVSAFGYEQQNVSGKNQQIKLASLQPANVRVLVVDTNNKELEKALVVRLDPNTSIPMDEKLTDNLGSAMFLDIPSGQASFVVVHPDYGIGWLKTAVEPGEYIRPVVALGKIEGEKSTSFENKNSGSIVKRAYAQSEKPTLGYHDIDERNQQNYFQFQSVRPVAGFENMYEVTNETWTLVAVSYDFIKLRQYMHELETLQNAKASGNQELERMTAVNMNKYLIQQGISSPVSTIVIRPVFNDTSVDYENGYTYDFDPVSGAPRKYTADAVILKQANSYFVEVKSPSSADVSAYLQTQHAIHQRAQGIDPVTATNWSQISGKNNFSPGTDNAISLDPPHMTVCCKGKNTYSGESGNIPAEASSNNTPPSPINVADVQNNKISYTYNAALYEFGADLTVGQEFKAENPNLEFTDKSGKTKSMFDLPTPHPADAPADFILDAFAGAGNAASEFYANPDAYNQKWADYLYAKTYNTTNVEGKTISELYNELADSIGFNSNVHANPSSYDDMFDSAPEVDIPPTSDNENDEREETTEDIPPEEEITVTPETPTKQPSSGSSDCPPGAQFTCSR